MSVEFGVGAAHTIVQTTQNIQSTWHRLAHRPPAEAVRRGCCQHGEDGAQEELEPNAEASVGDLLKEEGRELLVWRRSSR
jgi:hypothetical protein